jgi:hypothetical protein
MIAGAKARIPEDHLPSCQERPSETLLPVTSVNFCSQVSPPATEVQPLLPDVRIRRTLSLPVAHTRHCAALLGLYLGVIALRLPHHRFGTQPSEKFSGPGAYGAGASIWPMREPRSTFHSARRQVPVVVFVRQSTEPRAVTE